MGQRARLLWLSTGSIGLVVVLGYAFGSATLDDLLVTRTHQALRARAALVSEVASREPLGELAPGATWQTFAERSATLAEARVSVIARGGHVIADSKATSGPGAPGTRVELPEVDAALAHGEGASARDEGRSGRTVFVAVPLVRAGETVGVVRLAAPADENDIAASRLRQAMLLGALCAMIAAVVMIGLGAHWTASAAGALAAAARRMAGGHLDTRTRGVHGGDFAELGQSLDQLAENLSATLRELKVERDLLGGILSGMQEGVLLLDREGRVMLVNPALRDMLLLGNDAVGKFPIEAVRNAELKELLDSARASGAVSSSEIELGGIKPRRLLVRAVPLSGEPAGLLGVFVDVTEIRRLEMIRRDFVANVSHELRTPVTAIRSAAETVRGAAARDPVAATRFLDIIERNAERLHLLVEDLLDLSRIESKELRLNVEPVELSEFVPYVLSLLRGKAEKRGIELSADVPRDEHWVRADRRALEQVLLNLVDNAVKYCPEGSHVKVRAETRGDFVELAVEDDGQGIESKHLSRIFERFYRVDAGRSRDVGGTGLGLSIVKHMVESLGGDVRVTSEVGKGTTFFFTVPKFDDDLESDDAPERASAVGRAAQTMSNG
jgi:two-component system phosphate regulon sensor histidine kinase PhoR